MPIVAPGLESLAGRLRLWAVIVRTLGNLGGALRPPRLKSSRQRVVAERQHGYGEQRGVDRPRFANRERSNRNARRRPTIDNRLS